VSTRKRERERERDKERERERESERARERQRARERERERDCTIDPSSYSRYFVVRRLNRLQIPDTPTGQNQ